MNLPCICKPNAFECGDNCACFGCHGTGCLTALQRGALLNVEWSMKHFDALIAGGSVATTRRLEALKRKGLVVQLPELVAVGDGDGGTLQPERWRVGWILTDLGRDILRRSSDVEDIGAMR